MKYETFSKIKKFGSIGVGLIAAVFMFKTCTSRNDQNEQAAQEVRNRNQQQEQTQDRGSETTTNNQNNAQATNPKANYGSNQMPVSSMDNEIMQYQRSTNTAAGKPDDKGGLKYFITTNAYKLDLRCDQAKGFAYWNRIKVDYDQDKQWDEKWSFSNSGKIKREIASNDDGNYNLAYELQGSNWVKK